MTRADAAPLAGLAAILILIFRKVLFFGQLLFYRDVFSYTFPRSQFIDATLRSGHLPYWNPCFSFGEPAIGNPNYLFFYPTTFLTALLPAGLGYTLHYTLSFAGAALGAYLLARRWDQSRLAAFFAASVFAFSGPMLSLGNLYNEAAAAAWIPWALLATDYAVRSRSRRAWILLGVVLALQFLGAEPLTLYATLVLALSYALFQTLGGAKGRTIGEILRPLRGIAAASVIMLALDAIQLLPSLDVLHRARRGASGLPYGEVVYWSLHPLSLLELVLPGFFGNAFDPSPLWTYVLAGRNQPYYVSIFAGFVPLLFAWIGWSEGRDRRRVFAGLAGILLLFMSCGRYTPVFAEAYLLFPPLALVRFPAKLLAPAVFLISILAGWGVDVIREARSVHWRRRTVAPLAALGLGVGLIWAFSLARPKWIEQAGGAILQSTNRLFARSSGDELRTADVQAASAYLQTMAGLEFPGLAGFFFGGALWLWALGSGRLWAHRAMPAVMGLAMAQMLWVNDADNPTVPKSFYSYRPPVTMQPPDPSRPYRYAFIQKDQSAEASQALLNFDSVAEARDLSASAQAAFRDRLLLNRGAMLTGIEMAENLDMEGSLPPSYYEFWIHEIHTEPDLSQADCLLGRANVKYIVREATQSSVTTHELWSVYDGSPEPGVLYEDLCFMPRAYVVRTAINATNGAETLSRLSNPKFDAHRNVILEQPPSGASTPQEDRTSAAGEQAAGGAEEGGTVQILSRTPNSVRLRAEVSYPGYVVLLDRWDPGWHAAVDGRPAAVLVANYMFRAIQVKAGTHEIEFNYRPRGLVVGASISIITLLGVVIAWWYPPGRGQAWEPAIDPAHKGG